MKVSDLKNWDKNPRGIDDKDFERLKKQITDLGVYKPLLINKDNVVLGGNMRLKAYRELGIEETEVVVVDAQTEQRMVEYALSDNDRAGYYEDDVLAELVASVPDIDLGDYKVDMGKPISIGELLKQFAPEVEEDEVPEVEDGEPDSKLGEVYQLGKHRLMCGDATKIEDVERLMDGKKADMVFTDPPYGVKRDKGLGVKQGFRGKGKVIPHRVYDGGWDEKTPPKECFDNMLSLSKNAIIFGGNYFTDKLPQANYWIVWDKKTKMPTFGDAELMWTNIDRNSVSIIEHEYSGLIGREKERFHPTQKPMGLLVKVLEDYTKLEDKVLDLFGGSGSTLIACEQTDRTCYMMELDPKYCDVIRKRYDNLVTMK